MKRKVSRKQIDPTSCRIGFVGAGRIASSIICGLVTYGKVEPRRIYVSAPTPSNTDTLKQVYSGIRITRRNIDVFGRFDCDIIFICVNGTVIRNLYKIGGTRPAPLTTNYIPNMKHQIYVLSLIFGFQLPTVKQCLLNPEHPEKYQIEMHRIVLNCAVAYGLGICCVDVEPDSQKLADPVRNLLSQIAKLEYMSECYMDAACTICGAGLAFCYYFISAVSDGGLKVGLSRAYAIKFAAKVCSVAANTLITTAKTPNELKDEVCAPSGGAVYGLSVLDQKDVMSGIGLAVEAAFKRALSMCNEDDDGKTTSMTQGMQ